MAVDVGADEGGEEGGQDEGEEDKAGAERVPAEEIVDAEGDDGVPGSEEGGLHECAVKGREEAAGGEEGEDWGKTGGFWRGEE